MTKTVTGHCLTSRDDVAAHSCASSSLCAASSRATSCRSCDTVLSASAAVASSRTLSCAASASAAKASRRSGAAAALLDAGSAGAPARDSSAAVSGCITSLAEETSICTQIFVKGWRHGDLATRMSI